MSYNFFQDFDIYGHPELESKDDLLELIRIDIKRIFYMLGPRMGKVAVIKESLNGFHVVFPFSKIRKDEVEWLMESSIMDSGFKWWVRERGCSTLRVSNKGIIKEVGSKPETKRFVGKRVIRDIPFILETVKNPYI